MRNLLSRLAGLFRPSPGGSRHEPGEVPATPREQELRREMEDLKYQLRAQGEENDRLRTDLRLKELDCEVARHEARLFAGVIERDRKRVEAETAIASGKIAAVERGD